jgi:hypothetical protein
LFSTGRYEALRQINNVGCILPITCRFTQKFQLKAQPRSL